MLFISAEDFFDKVSKFKRLSRDQEKELYFRTKEGDKSARELIIESYLVVVMARIKRIQKEMHSLDLIYNCIYALEQAVDKHDFSKEYPFVNYLLPIIQQEIAKHIAKN